MLYIISRGRAVSVFLDCYNIQLSEYQLTISRLETEYSM